MPLNSIDQLPGFRRRFRITPTPGCVRCEVEDDYHCMSVTVQHDAVIASQVHAELVRAPWTTCPGAPAQVEKTFTGIPLQAFAERGEKKANCTHLYDLALLAAAHALDERVMIYDILVSDPINGRRSAELRSDGIALLSWTEAEGTIVEPSDMAGLTIWTLNPWIEGLDSSLREPARLLRWGAVLAHGRLIPMEKQSDASRMPANCYTFQPARAAEATRIVDVRDFSNGSARPLQAKVSI